MNLSLIYVNCCRSGASLKRAKQGSDSNSDNKQKAGEIEICTLPTIQLVDSLEQYISLLSPSQNAPAYLYRHAVRALTIIRKLLVFVPFAPDCFKLSCCQVIERALIITQLSHPSNMPYHKIEDSIIHVVPNDYTVEDFIESRITAPGRENEDDGFFVSNIDKMIAKFHEWNDHLPNIKPFYAVKCNDDPILIRLLHKLGTGFDCASNKEVEMVLGMGIPPSEIIFANSCKKKSSISFANKNDVKMMTFDSENELHKIKEICPDAKLLLRIRPKESKALHGFSCAKFGCTLTSCAFLLSVAKSLSLEVIGVSFHVGTGCYDATTFIEPVESARQVFDLAEQYDFKLSVLDVGGGFPGDDNEYHFDHMCNILKKTLNNNFPPESGVKFIAEPGRFFASASYTLATIITTKKFCIKENLGDDCKNGEPPVPFSKDGPNKGYMYYIDDGIASSFTESVWIPGYEYSKPFPLKGSKGETLFPSSIWGQTCASMDYITKNCTLPELSVGDWLYFKNMGAYSSVHASGFNGYTTNKHKYHFIREANWKKVSKYFEGFPVHFLK